MQQSSAWGQFWYDLSALHRVYGSAIFTPLCQHIERPPHRGLYRTTFCKWTAKGPVYFAADGATMTEMLRDGLVQTGTFNLRMKIALLAVQAEQIEMKLARAFP